MGLLIDRHHGRDIGVFDAVWEVFVEDGDGENYRAWRKMGLRWHLILKRDFVLLYYNREESCRLLNCRRSIVMERLR